MFDIWKNRIFPSIFPFLVLSNILIYFDIDILFSKLLKPLTKLFKVSNNASFIIIMSMLTGFPSNSKYVSKFYEDGYIGEDEASKILLFTHFSNPLFILGTVSTFLNKESAFIILFSHYLSNIIIGIIFRNYKCDFKNKNIVKKHDSFGKTLTSSITDSLTTTLLILGTISFYSVILTIINRTFYFNNILSAVINGLIEVTSGISYVSKLNIPLNIKVAICSGLLSFGGLAIHTQVYAVKNKKIKYLPYLKARLLHFILSIILVLLIIKR